MTRDERRTAGAPKRRVRAEASASPDRSATIECWWRADPAHEPDGVTMASYPEKASTKVRTTGTASSR